MTTYYVLRTTLLSTLRQVRVLFYATFRRQGADDDVANDAAHSLWHGYRGRFTLHQFRQEAAEAAGDGGS